MGSATLLSNLVGTTCSTRMIGCPREPICLQCDKEDIIALVEYPVEIWGAVPRIVSGNSTMVGVRNHKYRRTVIAMYICNPTGRIEKAESRPDKFI